MKPLLIICIFFSFYNLQAQKLAPNWESELSKSLENFKGCRNTNNTGINSCNDYLGKSLKTVYQLDDFYMPSEDRYMLVSEMLNFLETSGKWTKLGNAYEQKNLDQAQDLANKKQAVVAFYLNEQGIGNLALILPGELSHSGTWGLKVPNSSSMIISEPASSYINKGLSYAFMRSQLSKVVLYSRKY
jgi:hypothetical protein